MWHAAFVGVCESEGVRMYWIVDVLSMYSVCDAPLLVFVLILYELTESHVSWRAHTDECAYAYTCTKAMPS